MPCRSLLLLAALMPAAAAQEPAPTVALQGRVVDMRGEPVPMAEVWVTTSGEESKLAAGKCDGDGCFKLARVPQRDLWLVSARADGRCVSQDYVRRPEDAALIVLHDAVTLRGVLRNRAGAPVASACVKAMSEMRALNGWNALATTDAAGAFTLSVPLGRLRVCAVVPGDGLSLAIEEVASDREITLAHFPHPLTSLQIAVDGLPPTARVAVSLSPNGMASRVPPPWDRVLLDDQGAGKLGELPDVDYTLRPYAPGLVFTPGESQIKRGAGPHQVRFQASERGDARLAWRTQLRDGAGKPLPAVRLAMRMSNELRWTEAVTGADGIATFQSHRPAGTLVIVYSLDPRWALDPKPDEWNLNTEPRYLNKHACKVDPASQLELRAVPACTVEGRLLHADGRSAAFVPIALEEENGGRGPLWMSFTRTTTDREGRFRFPPLHHMKQAVRVQVTDRAGSMTGEAYVMSEPGTVVQLPGLQLTPPAMIEGVVRDADKQPAPGVRVWLREWDVVTNQQKSSTLVEVITDRQGRYRFTGVPPGGSLVQVTVDENRNGPEHRLEMESGQTRSLDLQVPPR